MEFNLADLFENAVDHFGDREYLVANDKRRTYAEMEARANRLAHHLAWAVFKIRAIWININYRYVEDELAYIFDNADLVALVYAREFAPLIAAVRHTMPKLKHSIVIQDGSDADISALGSVDYEEAMAGASPERDFGPRSPDDRYILYTGGTTGLPKGVVWRHEDVFFALGGGNDAQTGERAQRPEDMVAWGERAGAQQTFLPTAPLMHGASHWAVIGGSFVGRKIVLTAKFEAHEVWRLVEQEKVNSVMITGDAMGRPMAEALDDPDSHYDHSSLFVIVSTAAVFSPTVKDDIFRHLPNLLIVESIGSSETGGQGLAIITKGNTAMLGGGPTVKAGPGTVALDENLEPMKPGSGVVGRLGRCGEIPLEYYKDPEKTAETFVVAKDGTRYAMPGDFVTLEKDGTITLLGRGSVSINSGGEKIYPEEVEAAVKSHADAYDCVVVGVPDERFGSRVAAVVQPREGTRPSAGYKVPRQLHLVEEIERSPTGKPDYRWAKAIATGS